MFPGFSEVLCLLDAVPKLSRADRKPDAKAYENWLQIPLMTLFH